MKVFSFVFWPVVLALASLMVALVLWVYGERVRADIGSWQRGYEYALTHENDLQPNWEWRWARRIIWPTLFAGACLASLIAVMLWGWVDWACRVCRWWHTPKPPL